MRTAFAGWGLVAISSGFAIASAIDYLVTGTFSVAWLIAGAIVYGLVLVAAVALAFVDRASVERVVPAPPPSAAGPKPEPALVSREPIYVTSVGEAVRLTYRWPNDAIEIRHVALTGDLMLNDAEIETYVDALPPGQEPPDLDDEVDLVLAQREKAVTPEETA